MLRFDESRADRPRQCRAPAPRPRALAPFARGLASCLRPAGLAAVGRPHRPAAQPLADHHQREEPAARSDHPLLAELPRLSRPRAATGLRRQPHAAHGGRQHHRMLVPVGRQGLARGARATPRRPVRLRVGQQRGHGGPLHLRAPAASRPVDRQAAPEVRAVPARHERRRARGPEGRRSGPRGRRRIDWLGCVHRRRAPQRRDRHAGQPRTQPPRRTAQSDPRRRALAAAAAAALEAGVPPQHDPASRAALRAGLSPAGAAARGGVPGGGHRARARHAARALWRGRRRRDGSRSREGDRGQRPRAPAQRQPLLAHPRAVQRDLAGDRAGAGRVRRGPGAPPAQVLTLLLRLRPLHQRGGGGRRRPRGS